MRGEVEKRNQRGGAERIIPQFKKPAHTPFKTNSQKFISTEKYKDRVRDNPTSSNADYKKSMDTPRPYHKSQQYNQNKMQKTTKIHTFESAKPKGQIMDLDLKLYEARKPPQKYPDNSLYQPVLTMNPNNLPYHQGLGLYEGALDYARQPIVNKYTINVDGPFTDHSRVNRMFEDILPKDKFTMRFDTVNERKNFHNYIRSRILKNGTDGEQLNLINSGMGEDNSLLSFIKFLELNPNRDFSDGFNIYKDLAPGFLVYSSCYPIRYDKIRGSVKCDKDGVGLNIRIYHMADKQIDNNSNLWRELSYYTYVRDNILKKKESPNFTMLHTYIKSENTNINFHILDKKNDDKKNLHDEIKMAMTQPDKTSTTWMHPPKYFHDEKSKDNFPKLGGKTTDITVAITEAVNHTILGWASQKYSGHGTVKQVTNIGYHNDQEWLSVLFQLAHALMIMQKHEIVFDNLTLKDNVFIKDLKYDGSSKKHWLYKVDNYEYYVPNTGYMVMIDSVYKKADSSDGFKIWGKIFKDPKDYKDDELKKELANIRKRVFDAFKECFDRTSYKNNGINEPSTEVYELMDRIKSDIDKNSDINDIGFYVNRHFTMFNNNRIGTPLKTKEVNNVRMDTAPKLKGGEILAKLVQNGKYDFVLFESINESKPQTATIKTRNENDEIINESVRIDLLYPYDGSIEQAYKSNGVNLSSGGMIESYSVKE